jgi:hypothetical protein
MMEGPGNVGGGGGSSGILVNGASVIFTHDENPVDRVFPSVASL